MRIAPLLLIFLVACGDGVAPAPTESQISSQSPTVSHGGKLHFPIPKFLVALPDLSVTAHLNGRDYPLQLQSDGTATGTIERIPIGHLAIIITYAQRELVLAEIKRSVEVQQDKPAVLAPERIDFAFPDNDGDGLPNYAELQLGSDPANKASKADLSQSSRDLDGDATPDKDDKCPLDPSGADLNADDDDYCDAGDADDDNDTLPDDRDCNPRDPSKLASADTDKDGTCDDKDSDRDGDGVKNADDAQPGDVSLCHDLDKDGCDECGLPASSGSSSPSSIDDDGPDLDKDGLCDSGDKDQDGDGALDALDTAPRDNKRCADVDQDGCDECGRGDGLADTDSILLSSALPAPSGSSSPSNDGTDTDADGQCNAGDNDDDGDSVADATDSHPLEKMRCADADNDGCDECSRGDGLSSPANDGLDTNSDGQCNDGDTDDDGDGAPDSTDNKPSDPFLCHDSDSDTCDECATGTAVTTTQDGDDFDSDGRCDQGDTDKDGDGAPNNLDSAPFDTQLCHDSDNDTCDECAAGTAVATNSDGPDLDSDGLCDAGDNDKDGDGENNAQDNTPLDKTKCHDNDADSCDECSSGTLKSISNDGLDTDTDGQCNASDTDDDGDGVADTSDSKPLDRFRCADADQDSCDECSSGSIAVENNDGTDTDADGLCNAGDSDDDGDGFVDGEDTCPLDADPNNLNADGDALCNAKDQDDDNDGLSDAVETSTGVFISASDTGTDPLDADSDGDTLGDAVESNSGLYDNSDDAGTNPLKQDSDGDGSNDQAEILVQRNPNVAGWAKTFGGSLKDVGNAVRQTSDGGYIIVGSTISGGIPYAWLIKTDAAGTQTWSKTFGGNGGLDEGFAVQQTTDGGYIMGCTISGEVWLIKIDATGTQTWAKTFGGNGAAHGNAVQQTTDGGYIVVGTTRAGPGDYNVWLIKTDAVGTQTWSKTYGGNSVDEGYSVQQTSDGGYVVVGQLESSEGDKRYVWMIKADASGNETWSKTFGGSLYDRGYGVLQTTDNGYFVLGYVHNSSGTGSDARLIKTDAFGNQIWVKTFGGISYDVGYALQQTSDGGHIVVGQANSSGSGDADAWLIKTDAAGAQVWAKTFGGTAFDEGRSVQQTADGGYVVVGTTYSSGAGYADVWLIKYDPLE